MSDKSNKLEENNVSSYKCPICGCTKFEQGTLYSGMNARFVRGLQFIKTQLSGIPTTAFMCSECRYVMLFVNRR